eukprot:CAMPEP_0170542066 /NCGR_PEP_ID=MMETSP0211-20121228/1606_1 /TAXON_ID=311385 /ORGANISM="Pseudokeronopsis sp., Strain OXSARD2" /LENGTH=191 /DNA_ID=CAMNT_0010845011 /DNA_START=225 /DNA_END=802 /DNA_ORIENTATION=-
MSLKTKGRTGEAGHRGGAGVGHQAGEAEGGGRVGRLEQGERTELENIYKGKNDFDEQKKPKEDPKDQKKGDGIKFQGKPQFKKNQGIGNKALFPGLPGEEEEKDQKKTPADIGGPIGPTIKEEEKEPEQKTGPPKFKGGAALKNLLKSQNEENKEANVGIEQYKQKLQSDIKIHEKPQKREDFKEKSEQEN